MTGNIQHAPSIRISSARETDPDPHVVWGLHTNRVGETTDPDPHVVWRSQTNRFGVTTDNLAGRTDRHTDRQTDGQVGRQADRQTDPDPQEDVPRGEEVKYQQGRGDNTHNLAGRTARQTGR